MQKWGISKAYDYEISNSVISNMNKILYRIRNHNTDRKPIYRGVRGVFYILSLEDYDG